MINLALKPQTNFELLLNTAEGNSGFSINATALPKDPETREKANLAARNVVHLKEPEILPREKWATLLKTVQEWKNISLVKIRSIFFDELKLPKAQWPAYLQTPRPKLFGDHILICEGIEQMLAGRIKGKKPHEDTEKWDRVFVVFDTSNKPQSIALYDSTTNHLSLLVTDPNNLQDPTNQNQVRGTAKKIMTLLQEFSNYIDRDLTLSSTGTAVPFYEHLGFERDLTIPIEEGMAIPMIYKVSHLLPPAI